MANLGGNPGGGTLPGNLIKETTGEILDGLWLTIELGLETCEIELRGLGLETCEIILGGLESCETLLIELVELGLEI